jgi:hypothetical protein
MNWVKKASKVMTIALLCSMFAEQVVVASFISVGGDEGGVNVGSVHVAGNRGLLSVGKNDEDLRKEGEADAKAGRGRRRFHTRKERQAPYNEGYDSVKSEKKSNKRRRMMRDEN